MTTTATNFKDCKAWMDANLRMSTTSNEACKLYDNAIHQLMSHTADPSIGGTIGAISKMIEADPEFAMGHVFDGIMKCMGGSARLSEETRKIVGTLRNMRDANPSLTDRERLHCSAVIELANENMGNACKFWEEILFSYPNDVLALSFAYMGYLYQGNSVMLRDSVARVLPQWDENDPFYGYILNRHAFGLEETNMYDQAEKTVKKGLLLIPNDSWGIHTYAHVFESTCKSNEGIEFLTKTQSDWNVNNSLACHNYWHLSLYYIEQKRYEEALSLYDDIIAPAYKKSRVPFNINDGIQTLQRLEFEGIEVGERWRDVYAAYESSSYSHALCYDDAHMLIPFVKSKVNDQSQRETFLTSVEDFVQKNTAHNALITKQVGLPLFNAVAAYEECRFDDAVELLYPIKNEIIKIGGSHAQRDIFDLYLLNACIQSSNTKYQQWGRNLLYERKLLKPESPMTDRMLEKILSLHF